MGEDYTVEIVRAVPPRINRTRKRKPKIGVLWERRARSWKERR